MWVSHEMKPLWYECFIMHRVPGCYFLLSQWSCFWLQGTEDPLVLYCWKPVNALPHWIHIESKWKVWLCGGKCRSASVFNVALRRFTSVWAGVLGLVIAHLNMIYIKSKQTKLPFAKLTKSFELHLQISHSLTTVQSKLCQTEQSHVRSWYQSQFHKINLALACLYFRINCDQEED